MSRRITLHRWPTSLLLLLLWISQALGAIQGVAATPNPSPSGVLRCSATRAEAFITASEEFQILLQCTIQVPASGALYIHASSNLTDFDSTQEVFQARAQAHLTLNGLDLGYMLYGTNRYIDLSHYNGGTQENLVITTMHTVPAGEHTVYLRVRKWTGTPTTQLQFSYPSLIVLYLPDASTSAYRYSYTSSSTPWSTTSSSSYEVVENIALTISEPGWIIVSADGHLGGSGTSVEANFRISFGDDITGDPTTDRYVNVYNSSAQGFSRNFALSTAAYAVPDHYPVALLAKRQAPSEGTVTIQSFNLSAFFIPDTSGILFWAATLDGGWEGNDASSPQVVQSVPLPGAGWRQAVIFSTASVIRMDVDYEANFGYSLDSSLYDRSPIRWADTYDDGVEYWQDGQDKNIALAEVRLIPPGAHDLNFLSQILWPYTPPQTSRLIDPATLVLLFPVEVTFLPLIEK